MALSTTQFDAFYGTDSEAPTGAPADFDRVQWARLAAKRARIERVKWQSIARMITRRPGLRMELTGGVPRTDGEKIWVRVPIELGDPTPHQRLDCGKRREDLRMVCPACRVIDGVTITIIHECSHIANNSFMDMSEEDKLNLIVDAIRLEAKGKSESKRVKKIEQFIKKHPPRHYYDAAKRISPWLQLVLNAMDDGRVNKAMIYARPGTKVMFEAQTNEVFDHGYMRPDGSRVDYKELEPNFQAVISVYCKVGGIAYQHRMHPEVVERVDDDVLDNICWQASTARTVKSLYRLSIQALERLRELGFCRMPDEPEDDPEPQKGEGDPNEQKQGDSEQPQGSGAGSGGKPPDGDDENESDQESPQGMDRGQTGGDSGQDDSGQQDGAQPGDDSDDDGAPGDDDEPGDDGSTGGGGEADSEQDDDDDSGGGSGQDSDEDGDQDDDDAEGQDGQGGGEQLEHDNQGRQLDGQESISDEGQDPGRDQSPGGGSEDENEDEEDSSYDPSVEDEWDGSNPEHRDSPYTDEDLERDGRPEDADDVFRQFGRHDEEGHVVQPGENPDSSFTAGDDEDGEEVERALIQAEYFDAPSANVHGLTIRRNGEGEAWEDRYYFSDIRIDERLLSPALMRLRLVFDDNKRWAHERNLDTGRIDNKTVYRLPSGDQRIFHRRIKPGRKDWFVLIGLDVSGSTMGRAIHILKEAAYAKAELCSRVGVPFAVYAHTGERIRGQGYGNPMDVVLYEIKAPNEPWGKAQKERLNTLGPSSANLDGHTLEFYRKTCERQEAARKLILYYTDGAMPATNYDEELEILQTNIELCRRMGIELVGVGIQNDDPAEHGLDTIRLDDISDVPKVVTELEKRLRRA